MQVVLYAIAIALGASVGSFVDAAVDRFGRKESVWRGRSKCRGCGKRLRWFELVPVVSFLIQRGRCRSCRARIGWEAIAVEIGFAALFLLPLTLTLSLGERGFPLTLGPLPQWGEGIAAVWSPRESVASLSAGLQLTSAWLAIAVLGALFLIDLKYGVVPDAVTLPAIAAFIPLSIFVSHIPWQSVALGGAIGAGFFFLQWVASRGRWVGGGDIRLGALAGVLLGWKGLLAALFVAYVAGAAVSLFLLATKRVTMKSRVPFGPFLAAGTAVMLLLK